MRLKEASVEQLKKELERRKELKYAIRHIEPEPMKDIDWKNVYEMACGCVNECLKKDEYIDDVFDGNSSNIMEKVLMSVYGDNIFKKLRYIEDLRDN